MIVYHPFEGHISSDPFDYRPKTCFLMTQLGNPVPQSALNIKRSLKNQLKAKKINLIDAESVVTGGDYMTKTWKLIFSVPIGVAIVTKEMPARTIGNIFYELGIMDAYGKETLIIKGDDVDIPSDLSRTEYIKATGGYNKKIKGFLTNVEKRAEHYKTVALNIESGDPVSAIDYLRRAYLITGKKRLRNQARKLFNSHIEEIDRQSKFFIEHFLNQ